MVTRRAVIATALVPLVPKARTGTASAVRIVAVRLAALVDEIEEEDSLLDYGHLHRLRDLVLELGEAVNRPG